jgi:hypothetical protein
MSASATDVLSHISLTRPSASPALLEKIVSTEWMIQRAIAEVAGRPEAPPMPAIGNTTIAVIIRPDSALGQAFARYRERRQSIDQRHQALGEHHVIAANIVRQVRITTHFALTRIRIRVRELNTVLASTVWNEAAKTRELEDALKAVERIVQEASTRMLMLALQISRLNPVAPAAASGLRPRREEGPDRDDDDDDDDDDDHQEQPPRRRRGRSDGRDRDRDDGQDFDREPRDEDRAADQLMSFMREQQLRQQLQQLQQMQQQQLMTPSYPQQPVSTASQTPVSTGQQQKSLAQMMAEVIPAVVMPMAMLPMVAAMSAQKQERDDRDDDDEPDEPPPKDPPRPPDGKGPPTGVATVSLGGIPVTASPEVNTALQKAFGGPNPDAVSAYAGTRGAEAQGPWHPVERPQTGDVAMYEQGSRVLVAAPDGLKIVSNGRLLPLPDPNRPPDDGHGGLGAFRGFRHPSGVDQPVAPAPSAQLVV